MVGTIIKTAVSTATNMGIGFMAAEATKRLIPEGVGTFTKVCVWTGSSATACYVGYKVSEYTDEVIDDLGELGKMMFGKKNEK